MKITLIALLCCLSPLFADTVLLRQDFTHRISSSLLSHGWTDRQYQGENKPCFLMDKKGLTVNWSWKQNALDKKIDLSDKETYIIEANTYAVNENHQCILYLSSPKCSILIGNSYTSNNFIAIGTLNQDASATFASFQLATKAQPENVISIHGLPVGSNLTYRLKLSQNTLSGTVSNGTVTKEFTYPLPNSYSFDRIGFYLDGVPSAVGIKNVLVKKQTDKRFPFLPLIGSVLGGGLGIFLFSRLKRRKQSFH